MKDTVPTGKTHDAPTVSRREFTVLSVAAGVAAATGMESSAAALDVSLSDVEIRTPDGTCDAALAQPRGNGHWPAVVMFPDAFGLRPTVREMARRLAANGYTVLVPNPFYRLTKAPGIDPGFDFQSPDDRAKLTSLRAPLTNNAVGQDARSLIAHLDGLKVVNTRKKVGVVGYCMGGLMTMQASAGASNRIGAAASFHGGGLVTDSAESAHLLVPKMKAEYYFGVAANDDERQPDAKTRLADAFGAAHLVARIEVYDATLHGWCMKDMPSSGGKPVYNEPQAERAWGELLALYRRVLA